MIYITQLIYVKPGKEDLFLQFEDKVLPIMYSYEGEMLYRIRPEKDSFIDLNVLQN